ncbi:MAG: Ca2+-dependent phosphoinositide-specific phospholipase C [Myxococcota bacterium]
MDRRRLALALLVGLAPVGAACSDDPAATGSDLRLNELQAIGSHNSYHILAGPPPDPAMNYQHAPLATQLDAGVRHFEIDVHRDAATGAVVVYHVKGLDDHTTCADLAECLGQIRAWSDSHPHHHALFVLLEPKDDIARLAADSGGDPADTGELLWDGHIADIDPIIRAAWPDRLLTPAAVQGDAATLGAAIATRGWPRIDDTRGELVLVLNDEGALRTEYRAAHAAGDAPCFVFAELGDPDAAFLKADDPRGDPARLAAGLAAGLIARTRADGDTQVDADETAAAFATGAQLVSTDYPIARDDGAHPGYRVPWPGTPEHPSICNPVTAPADCRADDIE